MFWDLLIIFFGASIAGWVMEVIYRRFVEKEKTFHPGFLNGPYVSIYGFTSVVFYLICASNIEPYLKIAILITFPTVFELLTGLFFRYYYHVVLWEYDGYFLNYKGLICLQFSLYWVLLGVVYYYFIFPFLYNYLAGTETESTIFILGALTGIIAVDAWIAFGVMKRIKKFVAEYNQKHSVKMRLDYAAYKRKLIKRLKGGRTILKQYYPFVNGVNRKRIREFLERCRK